MAQRCAACIGAEHAFLVDTAISAFGALVLASAASAIIIRIKTTATAGGRVTLPVAHIEGLAGRGMAQMVVGVA
jgi:hypothetical protein